MKDNALEQNDVRIELVDIGEGISGDYCAEDPEDIPMLRFYCQVKGELRKKYEDTYGQNLCGEEWGDLPDGSYCTQLPVTLTPRQMKLALESLMSDLYEPILNDEYKRAAQQASWTSLADLETTPAR